MKISYILPTHNIGEAIIDNIESIINQDYDNLEIIYVDDNSTDKITKSTIKKYQKKDKRIQLIELKENVGAGQARKIGYEASTGDIVSFIDPDDQLGEGIAKKVISLLDMEWDVTQVSVEFINNSSKKYSPKVGQFKLNRYNLPKNFIKRRMVNNKMPNALWAYYFKREVLEGIEFPGFSPSSDLPVTIPALANCNWIRTTDLVGYKYVVNENSISVKEVRNKKIKNLINNHTILMNNLAHLDDGELIKRYAYYMSVQVLMFNYYKMDKEGKAMVKDQIKDFIQTYSHLKMPGINPRYLGTKLLIMMNK